MEDTKTLNALALALISTPRANLQELAKAAGISKATLYRMFRTREELIARLSQRAMAAIAGVLESAGLETAPPEEALRRLIEKHLEHRELTIFLWYYWKDAPIDTAAAESWDAAMDAFFLRGQQMGVFRIDISAQALTEVLICTIGGLIDAERRGRVARLGQAAAIESIFLDGAAVRPR
ncbi:TetR/AcrR family transcriptional regulator [Azoarcus sp. TTM-91]|uniref:TetR/AcrR family transcriptional regulator n=1 Tax=Azoarcus sp. TTM-91 TaxID=2691581 RepID=UPI002006E82C|nr:TetR/AcrR family transcriptional regulator [Azoarcus sp. TTM-91]